MHTHTTAVVSAITAIAASAVVGALVLPTNSTNMENTFAMSASGQTGETDEGRPAGQGGDDVSRGRRKWKPRKPPSNSQIAAAGRVLEYLADEEDRCGFGDDADTLRKAARKCEAKAFVQEIADLTLAIRQAKGEATCD